jgi:hypothetical protein
MMYVEQSLAKRQSVESAYDLLSRKPSRAQQKTPSLRDVVVELTKVGKGLFNTMVFQRPEIISVDGNQYKFRCTAMQADFYFFWFGAEAYIIEPLELRQKFGDRYYRAAISYAEPTQVFDKVQNIPETLH